MRIKYVKLLSSMNVYTHFVSGCTSLYRAILSNCAEVARELIHAGADVNMRRLGFDVGAETPLIK